MPETRKNPQDLDMVIYVYPKGAERNKKNAIAIFVYDQKETSIYGKPQTSMQKVLNGYKDKIRTGQYKDTPWQQFNYLTQNSYPPNADKLRLNDEERSLVAEILKDWDDV